MATATTSAAWATKDGALRELVYESLSLARRSLYAAMPELVLVLRRLGWHDTAAASYATGPLDSAVLSAALRVRSAAAVDDLDRKPSLVLLPPCSSSSSSAGRTPAGFESAGVLVCTLVSTEALPASELQGVVVERQSSIPADVAAALTGFCLRTHVDPDVDADAARILYLNSETSPARSTPVLWVRAHRADAGSPRPDSDDDALGYAAVFGPTCRMPTVVACFCGSADDANAGDDDIKRRGRVGVVAALEAAALAAAREAGATVAVVTRPGSRPADEDEYQSGFNVVSRATCEVLRLEDSSVRRHDARERALALATLRCSITTPYDVQSMFDGFSRWAGENLMVGEPTGDGHILEKKTGALLWDFGACSYMGAEKQEEIVKAAAAAYPTYGLSTVASPAYLQTPLLGETEDFLSEVFGGYFMITPKTHIGTNVFATTTVVPELDALVLDSQAHASIHAATDVSQARGALKVVVPNNDLDATIAACAALAAVRRRVWFCTDGVHSMHGTLLDPLFLEKVFAVADNIYAYVDDSHGIGWAGEAGIGAWLEAYGKRDRSRMVVGVSLCKAVAAGGGGLLFARREDRDFARIAGFPNIWTAPPNQSILSGVQAFFKWVRTPAGVERKKKLHELIELFNDTMAQHPEVHIHNNAVMPIKCINVGKLKDAEDVVAGLRSDGFYCCLESYPVTVKGHAGVRLTFHALVPKEVCSKLCDCLVRRCSNFPGFDKRVEDPAFPRNVANAARLKIRWNIRRPRNLLLPPPEPVLMPRKSVGKVRSRGCPRGVVVLPLTTEAQVDMLCEFYPNDDPLSEALGITSDGWKELGRTWLRRCVSNGISFVAVDADDHDRVVGGIVIEENQPPPDTMKLGENMAPVMQLLDDVEKPLAELSAPTLAAGKKVYRIILAATDPAARNSGVLGALARAIWSIRRPCLCFASTSSEFSRRASKSGGFQEVNTVSYKDWLFNGKPVFANARAPHTCASLLAIEYPPPMTTWLTMASRFMWRASAKWLGYYVPNWVW
eukprot:TRINITY_DN30_c0_g2_i1.p1 TRINITY_DN30_c0_g2~~TRINITY_DN30_c0_g2_i1.p1  ORF type:complete len:1016 (-),score=329.02 TRINITY_DN30_c0_g2_i1:110-3157(-)